MTKRIFDILSSAIAVVLLSPVMAIIAIAVRRDSDGPAIFRQQRVGRGGKPFTLLKFRSMTSAPSTTSGPLVTAAGDSRVTRVGGFLRSTKLDELPQLVNVLRGDMSIVGPRPEVAKYVALWAQDEREVILLVRPGITDPVTLKLRREEELLAQQSDPEGYYRTVLLPNKARMYAEYVESQSFVGDLGVVARTLAELIRR